MAPLLAKSRSMTTESQEAYDLRNKAYTHLKEAMDEICRFGRFVFRHDESRLKGYGSAYLRRRNRKYRNKKASQNAMEPEMAVAEQL